MSPWILTSNIVDGAGPYPRGRVEVCPKPLQSLLPVSRLVLMFVTLHPPHLLRIPPPGSLNYVIVFSRLQILSGKKHKEKQKKPTDTDYRKIKAVNLRALLLGFGIPKTQIPPERWYVFIPLPMVALARLLQSIFSRAH